jgi:hypothetical protein
MPSVCGELSVEGAGLQLRGASAEGEFWDRFLGPDDIVRVEQRDGSCLSVVALDGAGRLFEIANLVAELRGVHTPSVWTAGADWRRSIADRPSVLEHGYAWCRHGT